MNWFSSEAEGDPNPITADQLVAAFEIRADVANRYVQDLNDAMWEFNIETKQQKAMFLAQCCHESGHFRAVRENLNYSAAGLNKIFPKYFIRAGRDANEYHRQPEKIANVVYSNRMGNGDEASGDGWRFCGRGLIQLTGKHNYVRCATDLEVDLVENPQYLETPEGASRSAAWFWWNTDLNNYADKGDIRGCTRRINGGYIGLADRTELYQSAMEIFA